MDLYPTILDMAGLNADADLENAIDGISLARLLEKPDSQLDREALFWHYPHYHQTTTPVSSVREGKWKLLERLKSSLLDSH